MCCTPSPTPAGPPGSPSSPVGNSAAEVSSEEPAGADLQTHGHPGREVAGGCLETESEGVKRDQVSVFQEVLGISGRRECARPSAQEEGLAAACPPHLTHSPTAPHMGAGGFIIKEGCLGLSVTFLFISLLLSPQWRVRRIYWNYITETLAARPQNPHRLPWGTNTVTRTVTG